MNLGERQRLGIAGTGEDLVKLKEEVEDLRAENDELKASLSKAHSLWSKDTAQLAEAREVIGNLNGHLTLIREYEDKASLMLPYAALRDTEQEKARAHLEKYK